MLFERPRSRVVQHSEVGELEVEPGDVMGRGVEGPSRKSVHPGQGLRTAQQHKGVEPTELKEHNACTWEVRAKTGAEHSLALGQRSKTQV